MGAIVGLVIAGIVLLIFAIAGIAWAVKNRKRN
jgi:hypothetical protein